MLLGIASPVFVLLMGKKGGSRDLFRRLTALTTANIHVYLANQELR